MTLDEKQKRVIGECLKAVASGRFFADLEFSTLFGLERTEVSRIAAEWSQLDQADEAVKLAINNCFTNLLGYPLDHPKEWAQYISVSRAELEVIFEKWRSEIAV